MVEEYEYTLKKPIEISSDGGMVEVLSISLIAPSRRNSNAASGLMRLVHQSLASRAKDKEPTEDEKKKAEADKDKNKDKPIREIFPANDVVNIIAGSAMSGNTLDEAYGYLTSLLANGCGKMNDKGAKEGDLGKLSMYDWNQILGEYVSNFLSDSLFE